MSTGNLAFDSALILSRFGLGGGPDGLKSLGNDPAAALKTEIAAGAPGLKSQSLPATPDLLRAYYIYEQARKATRDKARSVDPKAPSDAAMAMAGDMSKDIPKDVMAAPEMTRKGKPANPARPDEVRDLNPVREAFLAEVDARFNQALRDPVVGFNERLVMFWTNHFCVSADKNQIIRLLSGAYEREAIRPHIFGRFEDMLKASATHPAMLIYLDNHVSIGPNSRANRAGKRGLNENLAREILELHTLGVDGGYSQADVTAFARVLTGWSVGRAQDPGSGQFVFRPQAHEPGPQTVLGKTYSDGDEAQGLKVLSDLARHPKTAQHIAFKLARHFLSDTPSNSAVGALRDSFIKTDGDLGAVSQTLIGLPEALSPQTPKMRTPLEYLTALLRLTPAQAKPQMLVTALKAMGQPLWEPGGPNGFSDLAATWASPESLSTRLELANSFAEKMAPYYDAREVLEQQLGPRLSEDTQRAVSRAESRAQGLSLAFLSPEFMRR